MINKEGGHENEAIYSYVLRRCIDRSISFKLLGFLTKSLGMNGWSDINLSDIVNLTCLTSLYLSESDLVHNSRIFFSNTQAAEKMQRHMERDITHQ